MRTIVRPAVLWIAGAALLLAGLYAGLRVFAGDQMDAAPQAQTYKLTIVSARLGHDPRTVTAQQGDEVTFSVSADVIGELHVHGYERMLAIKPGANAALSFTADQAGYFPLHFHDMDGLMHDLGGLEVQPR